MRVRNRTSKTHEVTGTVTASAVMQKSLAPSTHVEVRERQDGSWLVFYPDPGWIPCAPACRLNQVIRGHKHDYQQPWIQSYYIPTSLHDAIEYATFVSDGREVKTMPFRTIAERNAEKRLTNGG